MPCHPMPPVKQEGGIEVCEEKTELANATNSSIFLTLFTSVPTDGITDHELGDSGATISIPASDDDAGVNRASNFGTFTVPGHSSRARALPPPALG